MRAEMMRTMEWEMTEAEREALVEKAEKEAERIEVRRRRQRPRRRAEMDVEMAEAERVQVEREAKRAQLESEREKDEQRMEAEVAEMEVEAAELENLLAELEREMTEMEAEKKRVDEATRIFRVWWTAWLQAQNREEEEDREWVKTWALRVQRMFCVRRPLALMAVWMAWRNPNEKIFNKLYDSICDAKMKELHWNIWKKVGFGKQVFQPELEDDVELMTYCKKYIDFPKKECMYRSCGSVPRLMFEGPRPKTLQVFSVKIIGGLDWPLQVYGLIALRDFVDPQRNMIFNRHRSECQIVTQEDPYLSLSGPTRAVVVDMNESMGPVTIEAELKVKGSVEPEDKYMILDAISLPTLVGLGLFELSGPHMKLEISLGAIQKSVEATIFIRVIKGRWPTGFHGQFVGSTASIDGNEVILLEFSGDGEMKQSRYVMSVEASGVLIVTLKSWKGEEVGSAIFNAVSRGRSFGTLNLGSCRIEVHVAWSLIYPYCPELAPLEA